MKKILTLALSVFLLCGCSSYNALKGVYVISEESPTAKCKVGDTVIVELESNPTTGYDWRVVSYDDMVLKIAGREFIPSEKRLLGASGLVRISFEAKEAGDSEIKLQYVRSWEKSKPAKEILLGVVVTN